MGSKHNSENESSQKGRNKSTASSYESELESLSLLDELNDNLKISDLPGHKTARPFRQAVVLREQQRSNAFVQGMLIDLTSNGQIQRQPDHEEDLSTQGLGLDEELKGHPLSGKIPDIQRDGDGEGGRGGTTANIALSTNPPNVSRPRQATIEANHGGTNIAGWTTPRDNISVSRRTASAIDVAITLSFNMELAREYTGGRLAVLRAHEDHHLTIGSNVAQQYMVDNLRTTLQAMSDFRDAGAIQSAFQSAHEEFVDNEGTDSRSFDTNDYPRMEAAYYGVRTPLADLAAAAPVVQTMVAAIDTFSGAATAEPESSEEADKSPEETNSTQRLQYNAEFKGNVTTASGHVSTLSGGSLNDAAQGKLQELQSTLGSFTWTPA